MKRALAICILLLVLGDAQFVIAAPSDSSKSPSSSSKSPSSSSKSPSSSSKSPSDDTSEPTTPTPAPTTPAPTTPAPTTPAPTTPAPTTPAPTTPAPTTPAPTTPAPTTPAPTTPEPTAAPTAQPTDAILKCKGKKNKLLEVKIKTDKKPKETSMSVKSRLGSKGKFKTKVVGHKKFKKNKWHTIYACVNTQKFCYRLAVMDKKGNGIKKGKVQMFEDGEKIYNAKFKDGEKLVKTFGKCNGKK